MTLMRSRRYGCRKTRPTSPTAPKESRGISWLMDTPAVTSIKKGTPMMIRAVPISGSNSVRAAITRIRKACRVSTLGRLPALSLEDK